MARIDPLATYLELLHKEQAQYRATIIREVELLRSQRAPSIGASGNPLLTVALSALDDEASTNGSRSGLSMGLREAQSKLTLAQRALDRLRDLEQVEGQIQTIMLAATAPDVAPPAPAGYVWRSNFSESRGTTFHLVAEANGQPARAAACGKRPTSVLAHEYPGGTYACGSCLSILAGKGVLEMAPYRAWDALQSVERWLRDR